jgi:DNA-binding transcriptional regulator WhiA
VRRSFPEASLKELGEMLSPPVSKSGMNHRYRQLSALLDRNHAPISKKHASHEQKGRI